MIGGDGMNSERLGRMKKYIADIFLPNRCPVCSKLITWDKLLCPKCEKKLLPTDDEPCTDHSQISCDDRITLFYYEQPLINAIYALKHRKAFGLAEYSAALMKQKLEKQSLCEQIDLVACVPMSKKKLKKRRYNQAAVIAKHLSAVLEKPLDAHLLTRLPTLTEHHKLSREDRIKDAQESYFPNPKHSSISGKTVLLCDDVYTTGATVNACAKCLKDMGAKKVIAACIAYTKPAETHNEES